MSVLLWLRPATVVLLLIAPLLLTPSRVRAEDASAVESRLRDTVSYLASDDLEGRGVGTEGLNKAADYLAEQFKSMGLKVDLCDGDAFQNFKMTTGSKLGEPNTLAITAPGGDNPRTELKLGDDFTPLALGGSGEFNLPLVFVGYGITAPEANYDDYAGLDVNGKAVVILRREPQQDNPHSAFNGTRHSEHAPFARKVSNAYAHGAAAVIFLTDDYDISKRVAQRRKLWLAAIEKLADAFDEMSKIEEAAPADVVAERKKVDELLQEVSQQNAKLEQELDPILKFDSAGPGETGRTMPIVHCRRGVIEPAVKAIYGKSIAEIEKGIDQGPRPQSRELTGWTVAGDVHVDRQEVEVKNVLAVLPGEGPLADEIIVIGAHYDHLGYGGEGSFVPDVNEIHNGADDNASGTTALVEVARQLSSRGGKLPRTIAFMAFTGEERGLIGSAHYVANPVLPLDKTVAMLNMDMVGRLKDEKLIIQGTATAPELNALVDELGAKYEFDVTKQAGGSGPSDHTSFYLKKIPVLHFFTGTHRDYHRPSDDADKINLDGMRRVVSMIGDMTVALAEAAAPPTYQAATAAAHPMGGGGGDGDRPYFGSIPDFATEGEGYALGGVTAGGPAEKAGLKEGDVIIQVGDSKVGNLEDFDSALRKHKAGDKVPVKVRRGKEEVTVTVTLDPPRG
ncbi:MAG: M20/M25/M40 family metallo-hydrolase [Pirellulales bacterium]|nr:M20/M25/M40 family metallo-hydrolase [Pirellulales bacterium]